MPRGEIDRILFYLGYEKFLDTYENFEKTGFWNLDFVKMHKASESLMSTHVNVLLQPGLPLGLADLSAIAPVASRIVRLTPSS